MIEIEDELPSEESHSALIAGATGLIGSYLLEMLLDEPLYREVTALARRPLETAHDRLSPAVVDFERLDENPELFQVDDVFCCLGTTLKKAGSRSAFRKVDQDYVTAIARLASQAGARRFFVVSSIGADAAAGNFYLRVKGETEEAVAACGYAELHVFRPSVLGGRKQESRPLERAGLLVSKLVTPLLAGGLRGYRPIHARTVASAMVGAARAGRPGRHVYTFDEIVRLAAANRAKLSPET